MCPTVPAGLTKLSEGWMLDEFCRPFALLPLPGGFPRGFFISKYFSTKKRKKHFAKRGKKV